MTHKDVLIAGGFAALFSIIITGLIVASYKDGYEHGAAQLQSTQEIAIAAPQPEEKVLTPLAMTAMADMFGNEKCDNVFDAMTGQPDGFMIVKHLGFRRFTLMGDEPCDDFHESLKGSDHG